MRPFPHRYHQTSNIVQTSMFLYVFHILVFRLLTLEHHDIDVYQNGHTDDNDNGEPVFMTLLLNSNEILLTNLKYY